MWASVLSSRQLTTLQLRLEPSGVLFLTLHRPAAFNAISMEMLNELHAVFDALQHPSSMLEALPPDFPRVVVLAGAGRAFSGGVDIKVPKGSPCQARLAHVCAAAAAAAAAAPCVRGG